MFGGSTQNEFSTSSVEVGNFIGGSTVMQGTNVLGATSFRSRSLLHRSKTLRLLHRFHSLLRPLRSSPSLLSALRAASDRFDATLLSAFDVADGRADEAGMREAAEASWEIWDPHEIGSGAIAEWEMGRVWGEKREIFYVTSSHKPLDNFTYVMHLLVIPRKAVE